MVSNCEFNGSAGLMFYMLHRNNSVDPVESTAELLINDIIQYLMAEDLHTLREDQVSLCLRNGVTKMLDRHDILFTRFSRSLALAPDKTAEAFEGVSKELFVDGVTWSRIVALYALAGRLALYYQENDMQEYARKIPSFMSSCIKTISPFVRKYGGWKQLCEEFPIKEDISGMVWRCLLLTGAGLGLVAALIAAHS